ncbi:MAG: AMP-binding protein, partial [Gammaproteobacteria bacterium]|nr:AMP-binding protein [Gammaproteobacteria bacterium]
AFPKWGQDYRSAHVDRHKLKVGDVVIYLDESNVNTVSFPIVGFAVPDMKIRIGDIDGNVYEENIIGSILIKGPTVTQGYYLDEIATKAVMTPDNWFDTGDLGFMFNNELVITGRSKEIIFAHGQNYYPHDLESILIHSNDIELGKVAVYGVWDESRQRDELLVFIIFRGDLKDFVSIAKLATYVLNEQAGLEVDQVIPVNRIPKTTSGKFQRRLLADAFANGEYDEVLQKLADLLNDKTAEDNSDITTLQKNLIKICNDVLEDQKIGLNDNFFETGISSLVLAEIHQCIDDSYPDKVDITDLFEYQTIKDLSMFMEETVDS